MSIYKIPSQVNQSFTISKYELLMYLRGKKILGMIIITVAIAGLFIGFSEYFGKQSQQTLEFELASPISFVYFLIVIMAAIFGSSSISSEFNQKTGQILFSNPVSRTSIWAGISFRECARGRCCETSTGFNHASLPLINLDKSHAWPAC